MTNTFNQNTSIVLFKGNKIRKTLYQKEWWFSVIDVCGALAASADPGAYWRKLKQRLLEEGSEVVTFCHELKPNKSKMVIFCFTVPILGTVELKSGGNLPSPFYEP